MKSRGLASGLAILGGLNGRLNDNSLDIGNLWKSISALWPSGSESLNQSNNVGCQKDASTLWASIAFKLLVI